MKKILTLLLISTIAFGQPNGNGNGNGHNDEHGNPNPCKNPRNPNCNENPVPISGIWILILVGGAFGVYYIRKQKLTKA
jgi:hypothetical protein